jgi:hypothetical protein
MNLYEAILMIAFFALTIFQPYLKNQVIYEFCVLIVMPFVISYLVYSSLLNDDFTNGKLALYLFFLGALAHKARKFYLTYVHIPKYH